MEILREALAGSLESSDIQVRIGPGQGLDISLTSTVEAQFGRIIRQEISDTLHDLGVTDAKLSADDKGALACVIRARVQAAVSRAAGEDARPLAVWEGAV